MDEGLQWLIPWVSKGWVLYEAPLQFFLKGFIWLSFESVSFAGIRFLFPCSCHHIWISRCVVHLPCASIFTVPGGDWGPSPVLRKIWYKGDSESPSCYQLINAGEMRALNLVPTACPGNHLHVVSLGTVVTHWRVVNITGIVVKTGAGREELASILHHSKKSMLPLVPWQEHSPTYWISKAFRHHSNPGPTTGRTRSSFTMGWNGDPGASLLGRRYAHRTRGWDLTFPLGGSMVCTKVMPFLDSVSSSVKWG